MTFNIFFFFFFCLIYNLVCWHILGCATKNQLLPLLWLKLRCSVKHHPGTRGPILCWSFFLLPLNMPGQGGPNNVNNTWPSEQEGEAGVSLPSAESHIVDSLNAFPEMSTQTAHFNYTPEGWKFPRGNKLKISSDYWIYVYFFLHFEKLGIFVWFQIKDYELWDWPGHLLVNSQIL